MDFAARRVYARLAGSQSLPDRYLSRNQDPTVYSAGKGKAAEVIKLKDHLERRSQVVEKEMAGKTVSTASGEEADSLTY